MTPTIRPFSKEADRAAAAALFDELNRHEFAISSDRMTDSEAAEACVVEMLDDIAKGAIAMVAEMGGSVAGLMVWAAAVDQPFMDQSVRHYGRVEDIVVASAFRGKGIGQALLAEAERLTREAGMRRLRLTVLAGNDAAVDAYGRFGFRDYARVMIKDFD
jgi:ribosomal protein S18 acetylase RimI-like enzyme